MTTLRKSRTGGSAYMTPPPEAFDYDAEVTKGRPPDDGEPAVASKPSKPRKSSRK